MLFVPLAGSPILRTPETPAATIFVPLMTAAARAGNLVRSRCCLRKGARSRISLVLIWKDGSAAHDPDRTQIANVTSLVRRIGQGWRLKGRVATRRFSE